MANHAQHNLAMTASVHLTFFFFLPFLQIHQTGIKIRCAQLNSSSNTSLFGSCSALPGSLCYKKLSYLQHTLTTTTTTTTKKGRRRRRRKEVTGSSFFLWKLFSFIQSFVLHYLFLPKRAKALYRELWECISYFLLMHASHKMHSVQDFVNLYNDHKENVSPQKKRTYWQT